MKKKKWLFLLIPLFAMSLSACSFLDFFTSAFANSSNENKSNVITNSVIPLSKEEDRYDKNNKKLLDYTTSDLTHHNYYDIDSMPTIGNPKVLVIPIWFEDSFMYIRNSQAKQQVLEDINTAFFGTKEETGWYSVSEYFKEESYGLCNISGEVTSWYKTNLLSNQINDDNIPTILNKAVNDWKYDKTSEEIKKFDLDGNGYLDAVVLIYGYPNSNNNRFRRGNDTLWAWTYWLQDNNANVSSPVPNTYMFASYDFMYSSTDYGIEVDAHTYIHEMGHVMGLEDYYDYNDKLGVQCAGGFSMQDYNVGGHDPSSIMQLGWTKPYVPTESCDIVLYPFTTSGDVVLLKDTNVNSNFDEYILLEMYSPTGVNEHDIKYPYEGNSVQGPSVPGIRIWHVDARIIEAVTDRNKQLNSSYITTSINSQSSAGYLRLCSNTTYSEEYESYCSPLSSCFNYRLLELIRANDKQGTRKSEQLCSNSLFRNGDSFSVSDYSSYFTNNGKLNDGSTCSWEVTVNIVTDNAASITLTKN